MAPTGCARAAEAVGSSIAGCLVSKGNMLQDRQHLKTFKNTRLCTFFANGACNRGEDCNFAHNTGEVRKKPNFVKTRLCEEFTTFGKCENGVHCSFAHGKSELRGKIKQPRLTSAKMPGKKAEPRLAAKELHDCIIFSDAPLPLAMLSTIRKEKADDDDDDGEEKKQEALQWDPLGMNQLPAVEVHPQLGNQPSRFHLAQAMTVKNTFIHIQEEAPSLGLRRSKSLPAFLESATAHGEEQTTMRKTLSLK